MLKAVLSYFATESLPERALNLIQNLMKAVQLFAFCFVLFVTLSACASTEQTNLPNEPAVETPAPPPAVFQPGAPGMPGRAVSDDILNADPRPPHTPADVAFMQGMIHHHAQALEMTALIEGRTDDHNLRLLAKRIDISQKDEIRLMQAWLKVRDEDAPAPHAPGMDHMGHDPTMHMPGMLSADQMAELEASEGDAFYRLFLTYMIMHHEGALTMVEELFSHDGAGQETEIFAFATDVDADQRMEIDRMRGMLNAK